MEGTDEKNIKALAALIFNIYTLAQLARFRGLLVLEDWIGRVKNPLLDRGLELVVNGTDPDEVAAFFKDAAAAEEDPSRKARIEVTGRGLEMIQCGDDPASLRWQLCAGLDDRVRDALLGHILDWERKKFDFYGTITSLHVDSLLKEETEQALLYEFAWRNGLVTALIDIEGLCTALRGCTPHLQVRVIDSLPVIEGRKLIKRYEAERPDTGEVEAAMSLLLDWYRFAIGQGGYPGGEGEE